MAMERVHAQLSPLKVHNFKNESNGASEFSEQMINRHPLHELLRCRMFRLLFLRLPFSVRCGYFWNRRFIVSGSENCLTTGI
jgi:hypothetical protein